MSRFNESTQKSVTVLDIMNKKRKSHEKLVMVTCYDGAFARLIDRTSIDIVLVGDSVGNVMLGFENTIPVTMDHMIHHTAAVSRVLKIPFLVADMPFLSYGVTIEQTVINAGRLIQVGGAKAVKLEGGQSVVSHVKALTALGIPVMGHLGLTPQSIHSIGGYRVQGRAKNEAERMIEDAKKLQDAGIFSLVLEMVPSDLSVEISEILDVPTIGIGAGMGTDGQVLVLQDLLGMNLDFKPKFVKSYATIGEETIRALEEYASSVRSLEFPSKDFSF